MGNAKNIYGGELEVFTLGVKLVFGGLIMGLAFTIGLTTWLSRVVNDTM